MHKKVMFAIPCLLWGRGGVGEVNSQKGIMRNYMICPYLCSGHHYSNEGGGDKHYFSVQINPFYSIFNKQCFGEINPPPFKVGWWVGKHTFCVQIWTFCSIHSKTFLNRHLYLISPLWGVWVGKHDFSLQIWIFHTIPRKDKFWKLTPPPWGWMVSIHDFFILLWTFSVFPSKNILLHLPHLTLWGVGVGKNDILCAYLDISCTFCQNNI